jgi:hypothetical protein
MPERIAHARLNGHAHVVAADPGADARLEPWRPPPALDADVQQRSHSIPNWSDQIHFCPFLQLKL